MDKISTKFIIILEFIRFRQWYKNIIISLGLVFASQLYLIEKFFLVSIGFIALCLVSSASYIRNDIADIESDKIHPIKNKRALPSGALTLKEAYILFVIFISSGLSISFLLDFYFGIMVSLFYINMEIYSRWTKKIIFMDVLSIGISFIIRAVAGIVLIRNVISPWIVIGIFFVALFLVFMKRKGELNSLKENAKDHRETLGKYTVSTLNFLIVLSAGLIVITYSLYAISGPYHDWRLVPTIPLVVFMIYRQLRLSNINHPIAQTNEFFKDKQSGIVIITYVILTMLLLYLIPL